MEVEKKIYIPSGGAAEQNGRRKHGSEERGSERKDETKGGSIDKGKRNI